MDEQITKGANELFNYGILGIFCTFLIGTLIITWKYLQKRDYKFLKRTDEFTEVMKNHAVREAEQTEVLRGLKDLIQSKLIL